MASDSTNSANTVHTSFVRSTPPFTQAYRPPMFNYNHNWQSQTNPQTQPSQPATQTQPIQEQLPPPPIHPPKQENQTTNSQPAALPTFGMIMPISGGSTLDFENKRQRRDYFRQVHCIISEGPTKRTQWSHSPITFSEEDVNLIIYTHRCSCHRGKYSGLVDRQDTS